MAGALCISIDVEAMWGTWDRVTNSDLAACERHERPTVVRLVESFARHDVPVTWAVVSALFDRSLRTSEKPGAERCWYDPGLLDSIRASPVAHEIGSHSYQHVYFDEIGADEAREDIERVARSHRRAGLALVSFVFPRNRVGHLAEFLRAGFKVFRGLDAGLLGAVGRVAPSLRPIVNVAEKVLGWPVPVVAPRAAGDLVELPSSTLLLRRSGPRRLIHPSVTRRRLLAGLRRAADTGGVFHLWFHPSNFYVDAETQFEILDSVLAEAARLRDAGLLQVRTMGSFARAFP